MKPTIDIIGRRGRFLLLFVAGIASLALIFSQWQPFFDRAYLYPVSWTATSLLDLIGIGTRLDADPLPLGFCLMIFETSTFRVIHECTGIFALLIFAAALFAYPAPIKQKLRGLLLGLPAFFAYSALRLVVLGLVAHFQPTWIHFFHLYLMVLLNLGFLIFIWSIWVKGALRHD
jgi:exosortase/archaeosortase family protein